MKFNPKEVFVINTEDKLLPFKSSVKIKNKVVKTWTEFESVMKDACGMNTKMSDKAKEYFEPVKIVFVDSFTRILYLLSKHLKSQGVRGHDFWKEYRDTLEQLLMDWKTSGKQLVFTAIDEVIQDSDSVYRTVASIDGSLKGKVESYFGIVLWTKFNAMKQRPECYQFEVNSSDGKTNAKSPVGMFDSVFIQNDLSFVLDKVHEYYDIANTKITPPPILIVGKSGSGKSTSLMYCVESN
jgi:hypothetical protein